ncbi:RNA-directed DNA polymerase [Singulisphaera acidiphila]|uniref:Reverse transcriptase (RNA-dependent DNA polymerase) n=1 Tax=Singulisphaera acidiphila (strain ATCC BAA-1392 / DSM 18658 / VKM B-2454 / MOB10) TaxID=886293 RepID=L0DIS4_SINAD|nr:RNA-directed DNA polymerase [Singulisphaera acidiphila]AGA28718.1 Reverse transcriptase (RNA-dependent DNA polymerase) [Singulisphaera acidiphila DSM 18658]
MKPDKQELKNWNEDLGKLIHIRVLNYLRREHPLAYAGARILAERIHPYILNRWTVGYVNRRVKTGRSPAYWQHSLFKGLDAAGKPEFRICLVGSPTTLLQEVWALWRISQEEVFQPGPCVFSYLWPKPNGHQIFRHFMEGYHARERAIAKAAEQLRNPYVIVLDLKGFYPNLDTELAYQRFESRVNQSAITDYEKDAVLQSAQGICRKRKKGGLPIGPPMSHVIASIYMEDVDDAMDKKFPGRYFRYVDDVALVVEREDVEHAKQFFEKTAERDKLKVNHGKTDAHEAHAWTTHVKETELKRTDYTLGELVKQLTQYLAHNPEEFEQVEEMFKHEKFAIPFTKVKANASYRPFRRLAKRIARLFGIATVSGQLNPEELLRHAQYLRQKYKNKAKELAEDGLPLGGMKRRWAVQTWRFTFNRLLYLLPRESLNQYAMLLPKIDELASTRALYDAMISGDVTELSQFPGPAVAAFAQLWSETQLDLPQIDWAAMPLWKHRDAVIMLSLYGLCKPSMDWIEQFKYRKNDYTRTALKLAAGISPQERSHDDMSFIDELESLFLAPALDIGELLRTRFDKDEDIFLPALSLGENSDDGSLFEIEGEY